MTLRLAPFIALLLSACGAGQTAGPAMTRGTVPCDARGDAVLSAVPPPPPAPAPYVPIARPAPGAGLR